MVDAEFGLPIYLLNDRADEHKVLVLMRTVRALLPLPRE